MWGEIILMFNTMQWYIYVPLIVGVILLIVESYVPGFGIFGISGFTCIIGAIVAQGILYQSAAQVLFLISLSMVAVLLVFFLFLRSAQYGILSKTPLIEKRTNIVEEKSELNKLVGQRGVTITPLRPSGKFMINDKIYEGITAGEPVEKDDIIKVVEVEGNKIKVEKVEV